MNCVNAAMFLGSADPTMDEVLHRGRQGSSQLGLFWGNFFFSFWRKSLIWWTSFFKGLFFWALSTSRTVKTNLPPSSGKSPELKTSFCRTKPRTMREAIVILSDRVALIYKVPCFAARWREICGCFEGIEVSLQPTLFRRCFPFIPRGIWGILKQDLVFTV